MTVTYSTDDDVENVLGQLKNKLPAFIDVDKARQMAYAELVDRLALTYSNGVPQFAGLGLESVRWAEAKLAAADILDAIRVNIDTVGDAPERLRAAVDRALEGGIVGYPPGSTTVDDGEGNPTAVVRSPLVSSFTPVSAFPDPYELVRGDGTDYL
jgi:hypothetical protein